MGLNIDLKNIDVKAALIKLGALRNYMSLLVPLIIMIVAGLLFIPTTLLARSLRQKVQTQSIQRASQLDRMARSPISRLQHLEERKKIEKEAVDANRLEQLAIQTTQRQLLSDKIFPAPKDASVLIFEEFGKRYRQSIEQYIARLGGHDAPTPQELNEHVRSIQGVGGGVEQLLGLYGVVPPRAGLRGGRQPAVGYDALSQNLSEMIEALCRERARTARFYVNPSDIGGYRFWEEYRFEAGTEQALKDCWYWQLGYWVVQDVFDTVEVCNRNSRNVFDAPVKRIIKVSFSRPAVMGEGVYGAGLPGGQQATGAEPPPQYVTSPAGGLTNFCTARVCDDQVHVIHFYLSVVTKASMVLDFIKQLCSSKEHQFTGYNGHVQPPQTFRHNQITILELNHKVIDRTSSMVDGVGINPYGLASGQLPGGAEYGLGIVSHQLHRYGEDAVVQLDLVCEYMFEKAGYEVIMPEPVKKDLEAAKQPIGLMGYYR